MKLYRVQTYVQTMPTSITVIIGADIGGTNSNIGVFQVIDHKPKLLCSLHYKSQEVTNFTDLFVEVVNYLRTQYKISVNHMCIAAAGAVSESKTNVRPTNLAVTIDAQDIKAHTGIACVFLVNDFEVIGHGLSAIAPKDLIQVNGVIARKNGHKAILGAGTGLGKSILYFDDAKDRYMPLPSEGGHADFAAQTQQDLDLINFIHEFEGFDCNISWENVLSGNGIKRIYYFFKQKERDLSNHTNPHPDEIFNSRNDNQIAHETFKYYTQLYARCAKNLALDALALGGVYIAGGIAAKNLPMFQLPIFLQEFANCGKQQELLSNVPIWVITDYNVSLYGAAWYLQLEHSC